MFTPNHPVWLRDPTQPEPCLPAQFYAPPAAPWVTRLLIAVLTDGITSMYHPVSGEGPNRRRRVQQEAVEWVASDDREHCFSFVNVCETLGLDPVAIRRQALQPGFRLQAMARSGVRGAWTVATSADAPRRVK